MTEWEVSEPVHMVMVTDMRIILGVVERVMPNYLNVRWEDDMVGVLPLDSWQIKHLRHGWSQ